MIPKTRRATESSAWITPGTSLFFGALVLWLRPRYETWFGTPLPEWTRTFFDNYLVWIAISACALFLTLVLRQFPAFAKDCSVCRALDVLLTLVAVLIIAGGIIALFLPVVMRPA